jgi:hypothetical protein
MESLISYVDRVEQKSDKLVAIWVAINVSSGILSWVARSVSFCSSSFGI